MNSVARQMIWKQLNCIGGIRTITTFTRFHEYLSIRRQQAVKSLLIQVTNLNSAQEVRTYLQSNFGPLQALYHYSIPKKGKGASVPSPVSSQTSGDYHWLLAEFEDPQSARECIAKCRHADGTLPFNSSMCWYRQPKSSKKQRRQKVDDGVAAEDEFPEIFSERLEGQTSPPDYRKVKTLSEQLKVLEASSKLSELGIRARFFVASQLELAFANLFPRGCVLPFGSTVSGIGRQSGDLDLVLVPDSSEIFTETDANNNAELLGGGKEGDDGRLYYQSKLFTANSSNARFQAQRVMETMADVIQLFVPGCTHVQRILQARVPILRFWSEFTDLQCDLSMTNASGVHMSELIYIMSQLEPRFPTLLFAIRSWASARKITNPVPGRQPTNFMFVLLLIYFLQKRQLLPTLDILFNNAGIKDQRVTVDGIDCSFLRDKEQIMKHFSPQTQGESAAELLFDFFEFYSEFDFNSKGVSLVTGSSWGKPDTGPLYIQNPLERHLNVARNVSKEEVIRFKSECCSALWKLETSWNSIHHSDKNSSTSGSSSPTLHDLLLTPTLDSGSSSRSPGASAQDQRFQIKELFTK
ncbi:Poly(A) RNA polymerase, mitochondrial [Orchesella cincta]|uniref:Poly(A) RNA polymerase, mitochondrial n=1 Tax=Orchesella cincta TaxID=48709 RepID=A0A1D2MHA1_ORCCI|nr:Poly(A) RNA polymerase, mitochondrial [Orchesella cincta]